MHTQRSLTTRTTQQHRKRARLTHTQTILWLIVCTALLFVLAGSGSFIQQVQAEETGKSFKILAIGNSYSTDGLQYVWQLAHTLGYEDIIIANMYIGSSGLSHHWDNAQSNAAAYRYDKNENGTWVRTPETTLQYGIQDEDWDLITMHQRGRLSGHPESFSEHNRLNNLIAYIKQHRTNVDGLIGWQMTWAYEEGSDVATLVETYDGNQMAMYNAIVNAVVTAIEPHPEIDIVIPVGTALQNVRTSFIGDNVTRDGHHLSYNLGRYIAGLTWVHAVTGESIDHIAYVPDTHDIPGYFLPAIKEAVREAVNKPYEITPSSYTELPDLPALSQPLAAQYTALDWEPTGCAYWNSRNTAGLSTTLISTANSTASNLCYFVSSNRMFTRDDLPVGTIIEIAPGYQYRPEGWVALATHETRPGAVTTERIVVDEGWWGNYQYRAFNVSFVGSKTDVRGKEDELGAALRIYIPRDETDLP